VIFFGLAPGASPRTWEEIGARRCALGIDRFPPQRETWERAKRQPRHDDGAVSLRAVACYQMASTYQGLVEARPRVTVCGRAFFLEGLRRPYFDNGAGVAAPESDGADGVIVPRSGAAPGAAGVTGAGRVSVMVGAWAVLASRGVWLK
jgi:hypothetical protein